MPANQRLFIILSQCSKKKKQIKWIIIIFEFFANLRLKKLHFWSCLFFNIFEISSIIIGISPSLGIYLYTAYLYEYKYCFIKFYGSFALLDELMLSRRTWFRYIGISRRLHQPIISRIFFSFFKFDVADLSGLNEILEYLFFIHLFIYKVRYEFRAEVSYNNMKWTYLSGNLVDLINRKMMFKLLQIAVNNRSNNIIGELNPKYQNSYVILFGIFCILKISIFHRVIIKKKNPEKSTFDHKFKYCIRRNGFIST